MRKTCTRLYKKICFVLLPSFWLPSLILALSPEPASACACVCVTEHVTMIYMSYIFIIIYIYRHMLYNCIYFPKFINWRVRFYQPQSLFTSSAMKTSPAFVLLLVLVLASSLSEAERGRGKVSQEANDKKYGPFASASRRKLIVHFYFEILKQMCEANLAPVWSVHSVYFKTTTVGKCTFCNYYITGFI